MLFTDRSIWTMIHGIVLGGGVLLLFSAALYSTWSLRTANGSDAVRETHARLLSRLSVAIAVGLWLVVFIGMYVNFPQYRATPPDGADLAGYPRAFINSDPNLAWVHGFGMEIKEHMPFIAAMLATAVAFIAMRYRSKLLGDASIRNTVAAFLIISFTLTSLVGLMGIFANKAAPLV